MPHQPGHPAPAQPQQVDEFEIMRRRLKARGAATGEQQQRDISRQFAAAGNLPSGAAFKIRQQAQTAAERGTSEALQDVNVLQAQTQRAERESAAQRELQRFGITEQARVTERGQTLGAETAQRGQDIGLSQAELQAKTALGVAGISAESATEIANIQGQFGEEAQVRSIAAAKANIATQIQGQKDLQALDATSKAYLQGLDHDARLNELNVSLEGQKLMQRMELDQQLTIAEWEKSLKQQGLDIQSALADAQIPLLEQEHKLNQFATVVNAFEPMRAAGFDSQDVANIMNSLGLDFGQEFIQQAFEKKGVTQAGTPGIAGQSGTGTTTPRPDGGSGAVDAQGNSQFQANGTGNPAFGQAGNANVGGL